MTRTRLRKKFFKEKTVENRKNYNKRSYCVKKEYYGRLGEKDVTDNKTFWKTVKPFLSDKTVKSPKITLVEKSEIRNNQETFNFETIKREDILKKIKSLDISKTSQNGDVPTKIIKENAELFTDFIHSAVNEAIQSGNFPSCLK